MFLFLSFDMPIQGKSDKPCFSFPCLTSISTFLFSHFIYLIKTHFFQKKKEKKKGGVLYKILFSFGSTKSYLS